jgi:hypothetical protein
MILSLLFILTILPLLQYQFKDAYWVRDNTAPETPVITNLSGPKYFWLSYYILNSKKVIEIRSFHDFESYSSTLEKYYLFISYSRPLRGGRANLNNVEGLNRIYYDGEVTIYARL